MVLDAPLGGALQGQPPLLRLPRVAACLCCESADLLKLHPGFALLPAADSNCTGDVRVTFLNRLRSCQCLSAPQKQKSSQ